MRYLIRSLKYLLYFVIIFFICIGIVLLTSHQKFTSLPDMFQEGSLLPIVIVFVGIAAIYPALGYRKGRLNLDGEWPEYRDSVMKTMEEAGYNLVSEENGNMKFRSGRLAIRLTRMWEDAITFIVNDDTPGVVKVDGPSRDTFRIISNVYYNYRMSHPQSQE
ncbi:MAG: hypothetical protein J6X89_05360 [Bacteroidales bacterium]|nr:hypothetical protein [Bacteroidales bacterium]